MKTVVYVITSGCYSDYGIRGVSLSKKGAKDAIRKAKSADVYWADDAGIEEWEVDELLKRESLMVWHCGMLLDDGSIVEPRDGVNFATRQYFEVPFRGMVKQYDVKVPAYNNRPIARTRSSVSAEHAQKLATEARQRWLREKTR